MGRKWNLKRKNAHSSMYSSPSGVSRKVGGDTAARGAVLGSRAGARHAVFSMMAVGWCRAAAMAASRAVVLILLVIMY